MHPPNNHASTMLQPCLSTLDLSERTSVVPVLFPRSAVADRDRKHGCPPQSPPLQHDHELPKSTLPKSTVGGTPTVTTESAMPHQDPWNGNAGPLMWTIAETLIGLLGDHETHSEHDIIQAVGANPTTTKNIIYALARYGAIYRSTQGRKRTLRLTPLGAQWWNNR